MIEEYEFGKIRIDGKEYTNDVIITGKRIIDWWRKESHHAKAADFKAIPEDTEVLVIGTGASGVMEVSDEVVEYFKERQIELIIERTGDAVKTFNKLIEKNKKVAAALHLTC